MGRRNLCAVLKAEVVVAHHGTGLQEQQDIAVARGGNGDVGNRCAVEVVHLGKLCLWNQLGRPLAVLVNVNHQRVVAGLTDGAGKGVERRWQSAHVVALVAKPPQQVVHRRYHLHAAGQQRVVAGTSEVADGYALLAIGLRAQRQVAADVVGKSPTALYLCRIAVVALGICVLRANAIRRHAAVNLGNDDAGVFRTGRHGDAFVCPLIVGNRKRKRTE